MRIGIDIRELEKGKSTGIGRYLRQFLSYMAKNNNEDEFILFGNQQTDYVTEVSNQKVVVIYEKITIFWDQISLSYYIQKNKIDVFLTPYMKAPFFCRAKLVAIINDLIPLKVDEYKNQLLKSAYFKFFAGLTIKNADKVIAISQHTKHDILNEFKGVEPSKIDVIDLAVEEKFKPLKSSEDKQMAKFIARKYLIKKKYIFYFGNFNPHKNVSILLKAYKLLSDKLKKEYVLILGGKKNDNAKSLETLAYQLNIPIQFTGFIADEDLPFLYMGASVFVFPSLYEGFGLPVLEAMASGVPVVTSNVSSIPEVAGNAAILINPYDEKALACAMEKILTEKSFANDLAEKGLQRAKKFTISNMSLQILKILYRL